MIARFRPTYSYKDIVYSVRDIFSLPLENLHKELQEIYNTPHVFLFNRARVALYVLLKSLQIKGSVISPAYNCVVVPDAIRFAGLENQFVDISLDDYNMEPRLVEKSIKRKKPKILLATHQFGIPCDIERLQYLAKKHGLLLIEDSAAAMGAKIGNKLVGTFGTASIISFQDTKVISGLEGGALLLYDEDLSKKVQKNYPQESQRGVISFLKKTLIFKISTWSPLYTFAFEVWTRRAKAYTMAEDITVKKPKDYVRQISLFNASLVLKQLPGLKENITKRNKIAKAYLRYLSGNKSIVLPKIGHGINPSWTRFPVRVYEKEAFFRKMTAKGVDLAWTFSYTCPEKYEKKDIFPNATYASKTVLCLPVYPDLTRSEVRVIINSVTDSL